VKSLFDIQINGFAGVDFQQRDLSLAEMRRAVDALAAHETLRFFPTLITDAPGALENNLANFEQLRELDPVVSEAVCGYHLEGPWLSSEPGYRGAHEPRFIGPSHLDDFDILQQAAGGVQKRGSSR